MLLIGWIALSAVSGLVRSISEGHKSPFMALIYLKHATVELKIQETRGRSTSRQVADSVSEP